MKKLLLTSIIAISSLSTLNAHAANAIAPEFVKAEKMLESGDFKGAYSEFDSLAKAGNAQAIYNLGLLYEYGKGVTKDEKKALELIKSAAAKNYSAANYKMSQIYARGQLGVKADITVARRYLETAANQGFDQAIIEHSILLFAEEKPASDQRALALLQPLLAKGHQQALHAKSIFLISQGFKQKNPKQVNEGLNIVNKLAQDGYVPAMIAAGNLYANGNIVPQNLPEARKIFAYLAQRNVPTTQESLKKVDALIAEKKKAPAAKSK